MCHHRCQVLRKYKYPPDREEAAVQLVLDQAETLSAEWEEVGLDRQLDDC
uniref:Type I restriction enzyme HindI endonuclease subunit-like C-terminal domain-containing protein n=1 Tax=Geobacter sp. (strain M21) TaxID=443144 RepID=C6E2E0_GEOSM